MYTEPRTIQYHVCSCGKVAHPCYGRRCEECYASCQPRTRKDREMRPTGSTVEQPLSTRLFGLEK
jgi:hypothetical protein